jgi:hypothetical protein
MSDHDGDSIEGVLEHSQDKKDRDGESHKPRNDGGEGKTERDQDDIATKELFPSQKRQNDSQRTARHNDR